MQINYVQDDYPVKCVICIVYGQAHCQSLDNKVIDGYTVMHYKFEDGARMLLVPTARATKR